VFTDRFAPALFHPLLTYSDSPVPGVVGYVPISALLNILGQSCHPPSKWNRSQSAQPLASCGWRSETTMSTQVGTMDSSSTERDSTPMTLRSNRKERREPSESTAIVLALSSLMSESATWQSHSAKLS